MVGAFPAEDLVIPTGDDVLIRTSGAAGLNERAELVAADDIGTAAAIDGVVPTDETGVGFAGSAAGIELIAGDQVVAFSAPDLVVTTLDLAAGRVCIQLVASDPVVAVSAVDEVVPSG